MTACWCGIAMQLVQHLSCDQVIDGLTAKHGRLESGVPRNPGCRKETPDSGPYLSHLDFCEIFLQSI